MQSKLDRRVRLVFAGLFALTLVSCGQNAEQWDGNSSSSTSGNSSPSTQAPRSTENPPSAVSPQSAQDEPRQPGGGALQLAGVNFNIDPSWKDLGPAPMLKAKYDFGPVEGDELVAELNVAYYGNSAGGIEANLGRWIGQMTTAGGDSANSIAVRSKLTTSHGLVVHFVEIDGTYLKSMGGGPMTGGRKKPMPDHRMVGAIVEAPEGAVFFKLVGPEKTARAMEEGMRTMLGEATKI